jgi:amidase
LVGQVLRRIEALNPRLMALVAVDAEAAMAAARLADEQLDRGRPESLPPFLGVPISIKDCDDVAGLPTTHSCKALANNVASRDAPIVRRFREAGFIFIGKSNVPEFMSSMTTSELNGIVRNPWDLTRTPGGSSGAAAAAVAAGLGSVARGTDGAGSVRVPAAFCGLVGLKPSRRLVAFGPAEDRPYFGTSQPGVLTRTVRDAAALLDVMTGISSGEPA